MSFVALGELFAWNPNRSAHIHYGLGAPDVAEMLFDIVGTLAGEETETRLIIAPVWAGESNGECHWTLLSLRNVDKDCEVVHKDYLSMFHTCCYDNLENMLIVLSIALRIDLKMPKDRVNASLQPKSS